MLQDLRLCDNMSSSNPPTSVQGRTERRSSNKVGQLVLTSLHLGWDVGMLAVPDPWPQPVPKASTRAACHWNMVAALPRKMHGKLRVAGKGRAGDHQSESEAATAVCRQAPVAT